MQGHFAGSLHSFSGEIPQKSQVQLMAIRSVWLDEHLHQKPTTMLPLIYLYIHMLKSHVDMQTSLYSKLLHRNMYIWCQTGLYACPSLMYRWWVFSVWALTIIHHCRSLAHAKHLSLYPELQPSMHHSMQMMFLENGGGLAGSHRLHYPRQVQCQTGQAASPWVPCCIVMICMRIYLYAYALSNHRI